MQEKNSVLKIGYINVGNEYIDLKTIPICCCNVNEKNEKKKN